IVVVDHSAAAPYRLIGIDEIDADVVAVNALAWGGPPIGALVFRDPSAIDAFGSVSLNPDATGPPDWSWDRTSSACSPAWLQASNTLRIWMIRRRGAAVSGCRCRCSRRRRT